MSQSLEERIQSLLEQGKITAEDADRLRGASSAPSAPSSWDSVSVARDTQEPRAARFEKSPPDAPRPPRGPDAPKPPRAPDAPRGERVQNYVYSGPVRKVIVQSRAGNIEVDGSGERVEVESSRGMFEATLEGDVLTLRNGFDLSNFPKGMDWLSDPFKALQGILPSNLEISLPSGIEVLEIQSVAGNIEISDVSARVILDVKAGNIDLSEPTSFQIHCTAGNVDVSGCLTGSEKNSIHSTAGNVEVSLEHGSSVRVSASVEAGNIDLDGFNVSKREKRMVGESVEATLGSGAGSLEIRVQAGNLDLSGEG